jgi:hypothetical protein
VHLFHDLAVQEFGGAAGVVLNIPSPKGAAVHNANNRFRHNVRSNIMHTMFALMSDLKLTLRMSSTMSGAATRSS